MKLDNQLRKELHELLDEMLEGVFKEASLETREIDHIMLGIQARCDDNENIAFVLASTDNSDVGAIMQFPQSAALGIEGFVQEVLKSSIPDKERLLSILQEEILENCETGTIQ